MSIGNIRTVHCDTLDNLATAERVRWMPKSPDCHYWVAQATTAAEARQEAKKGGWKRWNGLDLCPPCYALAVASSAEIPRDAKR